MRQDEEVLVIGAGLGGLTAAALLAKSGKKVCVLDRGYCPGGTCGAFKRQDALFDQACGMLFGFGEQGFNPHRFVFNCLEESFDVIRHAGMYRMEFGGREVEFYTDMDRFVQQLGALFPDEKENLRRFYADLARLYAHVIAASPPFTTPDETDFKKSAPAVKAHPLSYMKFMSFLFRDTHSLLEKYFRSPEVFRFFDKLCATYCYTPARETPAVLGAVMFIENHQGGSFYPAGSALFLPGKLEKAIEDGGGTLRMRCEVEEILFRQDKPAGVRLAGGEELYAPDIIFAGNVWDLYGRLLPQQYTTAKKRAWAAGLKPTAPSSVVYLEVDATAVPPDTNPVLMFAANEHRLDDEELTVYISSLDDKTLCGPASHVITAIGPSFDAWDRQDPAAYKAGKAALLEKTLRVLERRFPTIRGAVKQYHVATPLTLQRYTGKPGGAAAGPKQCMGQHMFKRLHTRSEWEGLYHCGESTVMGTGTPAVTISGIAAANAVLKRAGLPIYEYDPERPNYVRVHAPGYDAAEVYTPLPAPQQKLCRAAADCQYCEKPACTGGDTASIDVPGILRRLTVGNVAGATRLAQAAGPLPENQLAHMQARCIRATWAEAVPLTVILGALQRGLTSV